MNPSFSVSATLKTIIHRISGRDYDVVYAHNLVNCIPAIMMSTKKVLTLHEIFSEQIGLPYGAPFAAISRILEYKLLKTLDAVTAVSLSICKWYSNLGIEVMYIPNAIDLDEMPREGLRLYDRHAIYAGRLSKEKGLDLLLEAFKNLEDVHLIILGDGPLRHYVEEYARKFPHMYYLGYQPRLTALKIHQG